METSRCHITEGHLDANVPYGRLVSPELFSPPKKKKARSNRQITNVMSSVTATSITRLVYLMNLDLKSPDFTWNFGVTQIWTCVELHAAIISGKQTFWKWY